VLAAVELVFGLLDCKSGEAVIRFLPELRRELGPSSESAFLRTIICIDALLGCLAVLLLLLLPTSLGRLLGIPDGYGTPLFAVSVAAAARVSTSCAGSYLRLNDAFSSSVAIAAVANVVRLGVLGGLVLADVGVPGLLYGVAGTEFLLALSLGCALVGSARRRGVLLERPSPSLPREYLRRLARFLLHTNLSLTLRVLSKKADILVISALSSPAAVALYKIAWRFAGSLLTVSDPLVTVLYPRISKLHASGDALAVRKLVGLVSKVLASLLSVPIIVFVVFGRDILVFALGPDYAESFPAVLIMLVGFAANAVFCWLRPLMLVHDMTGRILRTGVVAVLIQFSAIILLVPSLAATGAAIGVLAYQATVLLSYYLCLRSSALRLEPRPCAT